MKKRHSADGWPHTHRRQVSSTLLQCCLPQLQNAARMSPIAWSFKGAGVVSNHFRKETHVLDNIAFLSLLAAVHLKRYNFVVASS